jgi:hypothetical protein
MPSDQPVFAGIDVSTGRKPVTFTALDEDLNVLGLHHWTLAESVASLMEYSSLVLAVNGSSETAAEFKKNISQAGMKSISKQSSRQWMEVDAQDCFRSLCQHDLLPRRSLEGRIQRALILYEERLQIPDPMDFFEEITRHKLMQGMLPQENLYSLRELDALVSAYTAWMFANEPRQVHVAANQVTLLKPVGE